MMNVCKDLTRRIIVLLFIIAKIKIRNNLTLHLYDKILFNTIINNISVEY